MLLPPFLVELEGGRIDWIMVQVFFVRPIALSKIFFCIQLTPNLSCFARSTVSPCVSEHASSCLSSFSPASFQKPPFLSLSLSLARLSVARHYFVNSFPTSPFSSVPARGGTDSARDACAAVPAAAMVSPLLQRFSMVLPTTMLQTGHLIASPTLRRGKIHRNCGALHGEITQLLSKALEKANPIDWANAYKLLASEKINFLPCSAAAVQKSTLAHHPSLSLPRGILTAALSLSLCRPVLMLGVITNEM